MEEKNNQGDESGDALEHFLKACYEGETEVVKNFLSIGMNINARNEWGFYPLERAVSCDRSETVSMLIEAGADFKGVDSAGIDLVMNAGWFGSLTTLKVLLRAGASVKNRCKAGKSALHYTCVEGFIGESVAILNAGGWTEDEDGNGSAPLDLAIASGVEGLVRIVAARSTDDGLARSLEKKKGMKWTPKSQKEEDAEDKIIEICLEIQRARVLSKELQEELPDPQRKRQSQAL